MWDIWGVCSYYSFLSLCHSLNLYQGTLFFFFFNAWTLHRRTVSVLVSARSILFKRNYMFTDLSLYFWPCQTFSVLENQDFYTWWHQEAFCRACTLMVSRWDFSTIKGNLWVLKFWNPMDLKSVPLCDCFWFFLDFFFCFLQLSNWNNVWILYLCGNTVSNRLYIQLQTLMDVTYNDKLLKTHKLTWSTEGEKKYSGRKRSNWWLNQEL